MNAVNASGDHHFLWQCGCSARGDDAEALSVQGCPRHNRPLRHSQIDYVMRPRARGARTMTLPLHILKLVLPGSATRHVSKFETDGWRFEHQWGCGCEAGGTDEEALAVQCCIVHFRLLAGQQTAGPALKLA